MALEQGSYILLNKIPDFRRGICLGTGQSEDNRGITLLPSCRSGYYISRIFDTGKQGMQWHRLCMNPELLSSSAVTIYVYTCDSGPDAEKISEDQKLLRTEVSKEKADASGISKAYQYIAEWKAFLKLSFTGKPEILLDTVEGRYLWLLFEFRRNYENIPVIQEIRVEFPRRSYLDYLPEIYSQDIEAARFLHRFLALFQKMDEQLEDEIEDIPSVMDPCFADREFLEWMAELLGMEATGLWDDEQLRYLVKHTAELYGIRGTKEYLSQLVELYCKKKPIILTYYESRQMQDIECSSPFEFVILLPEPEKMNTDIYQNLQRIIELAKPAWMDYKLIILRPYCFMDQYSYTGINTVLGQYRPARLNDEIMIPYATCEGADIEPGEDAK